MIALDTNILARYLLADDEAQAERATQLIEQHTCFIPVTVGLELAWVLRSQRIAKNDVIAAFAALLNIDNLNWQLKPAWHLALLWAGAGRTLPMPFISRYRATASNFTALISVLYSAPPVMDFYQNAFRVKSAQNRLKTIQNRINCLKNRQASGIFG